MNHQISIEKGLNQLDMIAFASRHAVRLGWELCAITPISKETGYAICKRPMPDGATGEYSTHLVSVGSDREGQVSVEFISGHYDMKYSLAVRNYLSRVSDQIKYLSREY
jgi:hypothetical protein